MVNFVHSKINSSTQNVPAVLDCVKTNGANPETLAMCMDRFEINHADFFSEILKKEIRHTISPDSILPRNQAENEAEGMDFFAQGAGLAEEEPVAEGDEIGESEEALDEGEDEEESEDDGVIAALFAGTPIIPGSCSIESPEPPLRNLHSGVAEELGALYDLAPESLLTYLETAKPLQRIRAELFLKTFRLDDWRDQNLEQAVSNNVSNDWEYIEELAKKMEFSSADGSLLSQEEMTLAVGSLLYMMQHVPIENWNGYHDARYVKVVASLIPDDGSLPSLIVRVYPNNRPAFFEELLDILSSDSQR